MAKRCTMMMQKERTYRKMKLQNVERERDRLI